MRGYPGSRGTGGKQGVNLNKPPANQVAFETTEPIRDESIPETGVMLTMLPDVSNDLLQPSLSIPNLPVDDHDRNMNPLVGVPPLEIPLGPSGKLNKCQFFINEVHSVKDVSIRMTKYEDGLKSLEVDMSNWYAQCNTYSLRMMDIFTDGYYAAEMLLPHRERFVWARVQVKDTIPVDSEIRKIRVAAIDYGINDEVKLHHLSNLRPQFREILPQLGLKAEFKFIPSARKIPSDRLTEVMKAILPGKLVEIYTGSYKPASEEEQFSKVSGVFFLPNGVTVQDYIEKHC